MSATLIEFRLRPEVNPRHVRVTVFVRRSPGDTFENAGQLCFDHDQYAEFETRLVSCPAQVATIEDVVRRWTAWLVLWECERPQVAAMMRSCRDELRAALTATAPKP